MEQVDENPTHGVVQEFMDSLYRITDMVHLRHGLGITFVSGNFSWLVEYLKTYGHIWAEHMRGFDFVKFIYIIQVGRGAMPRDRILELVKNVGASTVTMKILHPRTIKVFCNALDLIVENNRCAEVIFAPDRRLPVARRIAAARYYVSLAKTYYDINLHICDPCFAVAMAASATRCNCAKCDIPKHGWFYVTMNNK
jgi:hypothetical protein